MMTFRPNNPTATQMTKKATDVTLELRKVNCLPVDGMVYLTTWEQQLGGF